MRALLLLLALSSACAHAPPSTTREPEPVSAPELARAEAAKAVDPARCAQLAYYAGNDRGAARACLDRGLAARPGDPALLLRRAELSSAELADAAARADLLALLAAAPSSPEAGVAVALLLDAPGDDPKVLADISARAREVLLGPAPLSPARALRLALLTARTDGTPRAALDRALAERSGLITLARALGPLGPRHPASLRVPTRAELEGIDVPSAGGFRGVDALPRPAARQKGELFAVEGDLEGLHVLESHFELAVDAEVALSVDLRHAGRVRVDGALVVERRVDAAPAPALETVSIPLSAGWHRLGVAYVAGRNDGVRVSVLGADGRPVLRAISAKPKPIAAARRPIAPRRLASDGDDASATPAFGLGEAAIAAELALSWTGRDLEVARAIVRPLAARAPRSAAALLLEARLGALEGLPESRTNALHRRALSEDPTHPGLLLLVAGAMTSDNPEGALAMVDRARAAAPEAIGPELARFRQLRARGFYAEADESLGHVLAKTRRPSVLREAASFFRSTLQLARAKSVEAELAALLPTDQETIGRALARGDLDEATERLGVAAGERARPAEVWRAIADIELSRSRGAQALAAAERALAIEPHDPAALRAALVAHLLLGDRAGARRRVEALRATGATDLELELYAAELEGVEPGRAAPGSWLERRTAVDASALARRPADPSWAGAAIVRVLERVVDRVRPDGSALSLHHEITRLASKEATDTAGEFQIPDGAVPLALRTLKADGRTVEVDRHAGKEDLSFSALSPGDSVEERWIAALGPASAQGGYARRFLFQLDRPTGEAELIVIAPRGQPVWWRAYHGAPEPEIEQLDEGVAYAFRARDLPGLPREPSMAPIEEFLPFVVVTVGLDEARAMEANLALLGPIARPSREISARTASITAGLSGPDAIIDRVCRWVEKNVRDGPGDPTVALLTGRGSRIGVVTAMLRAAGLDAKLTLARAGREPRLEPPYPDPRRFDDVLLRLDLPEGQRRFVVANAMGVRAGLAPPPFQDGAYVVVDPAPSGAPAIERLAPDEVEELRVRSKARLSVDAHGVLRGRIEAEFPGFLGASVRQSFRPVRKEDLVQALQGWANGIFPGARLTDLDVSDLEPRPEPFRLAVELEAPVIGVEGDALVIRRFFEGPVGLRALGLRTAEGYLALSQRRMPMWVEPAAESLEVELTLDPSLGAPAEPPASFEVKHRWGRTAQRFSWDPATRTVRLGQDTELYASRVAPADYPAFRAQAQELALKTKNRLVLRR